MRLERRSDRTGRRRRRHHDHKAHGEFRRMRHGDVRAALLLALQDGPAHGYELGQRLERASGGAWRPSPGSIYPTLQMLADEEFVIASDRDGKRVYELGRRGQAELKERAERGEGTPWQAASDAPSSELKEAVHALKSAAKQVAAVGTADQVARATTIVVEARRQVYELLAKG
jgi:DNA-binding PadR family transcriptional regulator